MPDVSPLSFGDALLASWHADFANALILIAISVLLLAKFRAEGWGILKNSLIFASLCLVLGVAGGVCRFLGLELPARVLDEMAVVLVGVLALRVFGLTLFRVGLPLIRITPPRILEDLILVFAYIAWGMVRMSQAGVNLSGLVTTSAVITGIIAFSMQETLGNILGGIALQLDNSLSIGDWIKVDDLSGQVAEVHWRHTAVRTRNGEIVVLPNSLLMKAKVTITGSDDVPQWRRWVWFSLSNRIPPQHVIDAVERSLADAEIPLVSRQPLPNCVLMDFKDGLAQYAVRYWLTDARIDDPTDSTVRVHIFTALQRHGFVIGTPVMDVNMTAESAELEERRRNADLMMRVHALRGMELFSTLEDEELKHLANTLTWAPFAKGDVITRQGAVAHWLYVLVSGEVDIWYEVNEHERRFLTTLPAGRVFGEMGMLTGEPRRATVIARSEVECYRIDKPSFESIIRSRPELAEELAKILTERNQQLVAVKEGAGNHAQHQAKILDGIRRFFRLDGK
ncbi:small-conductance mechanosensitive channel [Fluviicoccus keumensis]|uniref:Small-conductance mechanosensitive channel n=1 Tax=Fluviicoccus keumensis TaxID=1435465 RepID=A0A4Q7ZDB4_9GAMM|nr:mechanosensitive ion channel family protein [Fluviicoccus keumensis]RZU48181.1 small-conductance mechanosensitive channel [Fluviicoccus keumensis]